MKKYLFIALWTLFWLALEGTVLAGFPIAGLSFDVVFVSVVSVGFSADSEDGFAQVSLMGLLSDAVSPAPFGILTFVYLAAFAGIRFATSTIYLNSPLARFVWTVAASAAATLIRANLTALLLKNPAFMEQALIYFLPQSALTGLIGIFVIPMFQSYLNLSWEKLTRPDGLVLK